MWFFVRAARAETLVIAPASNQFDTLRIEQTSASNHDMDTEEIIKRLSKLDTQYGLDIVGANHDCLDLLLKRVPAPKTPEFRTLKRRLGQLCIEVQYNDFDLTIPRVSLWWD